MAKRILCLILILLLELTACQPSPSDPTGGSVVPTGSEPTDAAPTTQVPTDTSPMLSVSLPLTTQTVYAEDGTPLFSHTYPDVSLILEDPQVAEKIVLDLLNRIDSAVPAADALRADAESEYSGQENWMPYQYRVAYRPSRLDKAVLSLYGSEISNAGNAHSYEAPKCVTYDLLTGKVLSLPDILENGYTGLPELLSDALEPLSDTLLGDYSDVVADLFRHGDPGNWYLSPGGLCFAFAPYEIAPYSVGVVTAEIPYTALTGILRDAYFPPEQPDSSGNLLAQPFSEADLSQYRRFSELILDSNGPSVLLTADGTVSDIRITLCTAPASGSGEFVSDATVFALRQLSPGNGILLQAQLSGGTQMLQIRYRSGGKIVTEYLTMRNGTAVLTAE